MTNPRTLKDRKEEMYAAQTLASGLAGRIHEAQRDGSSPAVVAALIAEQTMQNQIVLRLVTEVTTESMSANLMTFLDRLDAGMEAGNARILAVLEETARGLGKRLGKLEEGQGKFEEGQGRLATQVSDLGERLSEVDLTIAAFRESRDQSIEERKQHRHEIDALRQSYLDLSVQITGALALSAQASSLLALADYAIITIDEQQRIMFVNDETEALFGYARAELIGQPIDVLIPVRFRAWHHRHIEQFAAGPIATRRMAERQPIAGRHKDGHDIPIRAAISRQMSEGKMTFVVMLRATMEPTHSLGVDDAGGI